MKDKNSIYRYYGQYGEDYILWNFFDYKIEGFYVDVGAFDGIHLSNSYSFEQQGWKGICIEPVPQNYSLCKKNRPKSICINAACISSDEPHEIELEVDDLGLFSSINSIKDREDIEYHYSNLKKDFSIKKFKVPATTLNKILLQNNIFDLFPLDFISIDVEGQEIDVLSGLNLKKYSPTIIVIETNTPEDTSKTSNYLQQFGYLHARKQLANSYYVKDEKSAERIKSIELTCTIEKQMHPLGVDYTIKDYYDGLYFYKGEKVYNQIISLENRLRRQDDRIKQKDDQIKQKDDQIKQKDQRIMQLEKDLSILSSGYTYLTGKVILWSIRFFISSFRKVKIKMDQIKNKLK